MSLEMFYILDVLPKPSSQTTSYQLEPVGGGQQIELDSMSFHAGSFPIQAPRERTWDEVMKEVLHDYSEAWERLAGL